MRSFAYLRCRVSFRYFVAKRSSVRRFGQQDEAFYNIRIKSFGVFEIMEIFEISKIPKTSFARRILVIISVSFRRARSIFYFWNFFQVDVLYDYALRSLLVLSFKERYLIKEHLPCLGNFFLYSVSNSSSMFLSRYLDAFASSDVSSVFCLS